MYELYDDLQAAIYSLEDASDVLTAFPEEKSVIDELLFTLREKLDEVEKAICKFENKEIAALSREYFKNL